MQLSTNQPEKHRAEIAHAIHEAPEVALTAPPGGGDDDPPSTRKRLRMRNRALNAKVQHRITNCGTALPMDTGHVIH